MTIAIASGKGGTGKTTLAVNLSLYLAGLGHRPVLMDLDVEAPNCAGLLGVQFVAEDAVELPLPVANNDACTHCGVCAGVCSFNAIAVTSASVMVFPELCHFCGRCVLRCPQGALTSRPFRIGRMRQGRVGGLDVVEGRLDTGQTQTARLIGEVKRRRPDPQLIVRDCPPGTTCPMVASVRGADYVVLVTEPTPFGRHDLGLAIEAMGRLSLPFGVVINKADGEDGQFAREAEEQGYPILGQIPLSLDYARRGAEGLPLLDLPEYRERIGQIAQALFAQCEGGGLS